MELDTLESLPADALLYARVLAYVRSRPWAITPDMLAVITDILAFRSMGGRLSRDEINARIGGPKAAVQPARTNVRGGVQVLALRGLISHRAAMLDDVSGPRGTSVEAFTKRFREALANPDVGSIVLDVDSPGGTVDGVPELASEIFQSRGQKPIVAVANTIAGSAAFWIASQADELVVTPSGQVGSIGVFTAHEDKSAALEAEGRKITLISAGDFKTEGNPFEPLSEDARAAIQVDVDAAFATFVRAVARGRSTTTTRVKSDFGRGRMVSADSAKAVGMVDRIETLDQTVARLTAKPRARRRVAASAKYGHAFK